LTSAEERPHIRRCTAKFRAASGVRRETPTQSRQAGYFMPSNHDFEHALKNYMAVILGYADLLLDECGATDGRRQDLLEIHKAATAAVALVDSLNATRP
jgi:hypothetical protein